MTDALETWTCPACDAAGSYRAAAGVAWCVSCGADAPVIRRRTGGRSGTSPAPPPPAAPPAFSRARHISPRVDKNNPAPRNPREPT